MYGEDCSQNGSDYDICYDIKLHALRNRPVAEVRELYDRLRYRGGIFEGLFYIISLERIATVDACRTILDEEDKRLELKGQ